MVGILLYRWSISVGFILCNKTRTFLFILPVSLWVDACGEVKSNTPNDSHNTLTYRELSCNVFISLLHFTHSHGHIQAMLLVNHSPASFIQSQVASMDKGGTTPIHPVDMCPSFLHKQSLACRLATQNSNCGWIYDPFKITTWQLETSSFWPPGITSHISGLSG